jgi:hypothetical protein
MGAQITLYCELRRSCKHGYGTCFTYGRRFEQAIGMCMYVCMYVYDHVSVCVDMYVYAYVCIYVGFVDMENGVDVPVCMYACMYVS